jgi:hypothetical protein
MDGRTQSYARNELEVSPQEGHSLWVFGGHGYDGKGKLTHLNDLWSFRYSHEDGEDGESGSTVHPPRRESNRGAAKSATAATNDPLNDPLSSRLSPLMLWGVGVVAVGAIALVAHGMSRDGGGADQSVADCGTEEEAYSLLASKDRTSQRVDAVGDGRTPYTAAPEKPPE